ncbi:MAG: hypothetical protein NTV08_07595 [Verrucomicrobia bacterium]|nr:hypothetical protein [Verrucomicrobiota bacterium]
MPRFRRGGKAGQLFPTSHESPRKDGQVFEIAGHLVETDGHHFRFVGQLFEKVTCIPGMMASLWKIAVVPFGKRVIHFAFLLSFLEMRVGSLGLVVSRLKRLAITFAALVRISGTPVILPEWLAVFLASSRAWEPAAILRKETPAGRNDQWRSVCGRWKDAGGGRQCIIICENQTY